MLLPRRVLAVIISFSVVVVAGGGCLFPDFDKFDSGDGGGAAASPPLSKEIQCDALKCFADYQYCCSNAPKSASSDGPTACFDKSKTDLCPDVDGTTKLRFFCDGEEDCPTGQVCCFTSGTPDITCKTTCDAAVVCTGNGEGKRSNCPAGKVCTGTLPLGHRSCAPPS